MISPDPTVHPCSIDRAILGWMQELTPHGILVTDAQLRINRWNLWLESNSGLKREEVLDRPLFEVFPEIVTRRMDRYFQSAMKGEVSLLSSALHGYLLPFASPVREAGFLNMLQTARIGPLVERGEVVGTITTIEDVTQREYQNSRVTRQHQRQELFSWALAQLIETPNPERMVKRIFPRISAHMFVDTYFNYFLEPDGQHLRLHSAGGIPRDMQERIGMITVGQALCGTSVRDGGPVVVPCIHESRDPKAAFARSLGLRAYVCNPLLVGEKLIGTLAFASRTRDSFTNDEVEFTRIVAQYVAIAIERARNEAALRKAEGELRSHAGLLEQKVLERTRKLQETIAELESFSYSLAHDVRAPLRHIHGFSEALLEDHGKELSTDARSYVDSIMRAVLRLETLTRDILEYSKVSSKPVELRPVNLEALVKSIVAHSPGLSVDEVVAVKSPLHRVMAERALLQQSLSNLLDNALKFIPAEVGPRIVVRTEINEDTALAAEQRPSKSSMPAPLNPVSAPHAAPDEAAASADRGGTVPTAPRWVRIWVEDNGVGISPEFHRKIFGIFERLSHQEEGTGIGLAIVSKAVQRMGGRLGVESESGKGSRFWIELPAAD
jgi:signal transduction histidine kinase